MCDTPWLDLTKPWMTLTAPWITLRVLWTALYLCGVGVGGDSPALHGRHFPLQEYCDSETFRAECRADEVVVITEAEYGRHTRQRCITYDYGSAHCKVDVLLAVDALCSGLQACHFEIDDDTFASYHPGCPADFKSHLTVAYMCVPVHVPERSCRGSFPSVDSTRLRTITLPDVTSAPRYISSDVTRTTGCGSTMSPWILRAPGAQRIALSMVDFSLNGTTALTADAVRTPIDTGVCKVYFSVRDGSEHAQPHRRTSTICGHLQPRMRHQFTSTNSQIQIRIMQADTRSPDIEVNKPPRFLIMYQVVGCPDPPKPLNGWNRRVGDDRALLGCDSDPDTGRWTLTCDINTWRGNHDNCTGDAETAFLEQFVNSVHGLPFGLSVALVVAIAFVVSCLILLIGICVITRRNSRKRRQHELQLAATLGQRQAPDPERQVPEHKSKYQAIKGGQADNMYTDSDTVSKGGGTGELYTLRAEDCSDKYSGYRRHSSSRSADYYPTSEHIYEYPSPEKVAVDYSKMAVGHVPQYFDIDPSLGHVCTLPDVPKGPRDPASSRNNSARGTPSTGTGGHVVTGSEEI